MDTRPVREGVSTDGQKFHAGPPCPTLICPAGRAPRKRPHGCLGGGLRPSSSPLDTPTYGPALGSPWIPHMRSWCENNRRKALLVIGSLSPISVEGLIRGLRWGIGPEGAKALSSHHIWMFIPSVGQHQGGRYVCVSGLGWFRWC
jgi:hypothetical protein